MAKRVQIIGNTTAGTATFVGLAREVTLDTDRQELIVNTGSGAGTQKRVPNKDTNDTLYQALNGVLTAVAGITAADGILVKTAAGTVAARTLTSTGLSVTNGGGAAGNPTIEFLTTTQIGGMIALTGLLSLSGGGALGAGTFTGGKFKSPTGTVNALGTLTASQTVDITSGGTITCTFGALAANATIIFSGYPASGIYAGWEVHVIMDATPHTITFQRSSGNSVTYDSVSGAPAGVASKTMKFYFDTTDGGTTVTCTYRGSF